MNLGPQSIAVLAVVGLLAAVAFINLLVYRGPDEGARCPEVRGQVTCDARQHPHPGMHHDGQLGIWWEPEQPTREGW